MTSAATAIPSVSGRVPDDPLVKRLGYAGLLPFFVGALLVWLVRPDVRPYVANAMSAYAAVIVSFLGAIHWGLAMRQSQPSPRLFSWGVTPALIAWIAVVMPANAGLVVHGVMLAVCYAVDRKVYPAQGVGAWLKLRFRLSALASLFCFVGAAGS
jgi:putative flippase GtrA